MKITKSHTVKVQVIYKDSKKGFHDNTDMYETIHEAFRNSPKYKSVESANGGLGDSSIILIVEESDENN